MLNPRNSYYVYTVTRPATQRPYWPKKPPPPAAIGAGEPLNIDRIASFFFSWPSASGAATGAGGGPLVACSRNCHYGTPLLYRRPPQVREQARAIGGRREKHAWAGCAQINGVADPVHAVDAPSAHGHRVEERERWRSTSTRLSWRTSAVLRKSCWQRGDNAPRREVLGAPQREIAAAAGKKIVS